MHKIDLKTPKDLEKMARGGKILKETKEVVNEAIKVGVSAADIEKIATEFIESKGAEPSFKKVSGYSWTTCINVNEGVVHGIPHSDIIFAPNDVVSVDLGVFYEGFHTDSALTKYLGDDPTIKKFLSSGMRALDKAINAAKVGNTIKDIARATQSTIEASGYSIIKALTGHGVGRELHEDPRVPCFVSGSPDEAVEIVAGMTLAVEIMYTTGKGDIKLEKDGWTLSTKDAKISALFEDTVAITTNGKRILTR